MTSAQNMQMHLQRLGMAMDTLRRKRPYDAEQVGSALATTLSELLDCLGDLATEIDAVARRVDALENKNK